MGAVDVERPVAQRRRCQLPGATVVNGDAAADQTLTRAAIDEAVRDWVFASQLATYYCIGPRRWPGRIPIRYLRA